MACIYIAHGEGGLLKVGMTSEISRRKSSLKQEFRRRGDVLTKVQQIAEVDDDFARAVERRVIGFVTGFGVEPCSGREWFRGVGFDEVLAQSARFMKEAIRLAKRFHTTPQQWEAMRIENARRKAADNESRLRYRLEAEARAQRRRLLRSGSDRCFEHIACAALHGVSSLDLPKRKPAKVEG